VVLIAGEKIVAVGRRGEVTIPDGTPVVSTAGMRMLPGLMDMHVHLMILAHADDKHWDLTYRSRFRREIMPIAAKQLLRDGSATGSSPPTRPPSPRGGSPSAGSRRPAGARREGGSAHRVTVSRYGM
jgi:hypothetical protein